jgi:hypothetical protein
MGQQRPEVSGLVMYHIVTTMHAKGWEETGRRMVESFLAHWNYPLTIYAEDFDPDIPGAEVRKLPEWLADFKRVHSTVEAHVGRRNGGYDYRFDAVKFAHKVAALTDFGENLTDGVLIWLDADTFTHADVTDEWLESLFPEPAYIAWLDRHNSHPECGFVMYRCSHPYHRNFMQSFRGLYTSGNLFKLAETHDSFALQYLVIVKANGQKIPQPVSLSGDKGWHHPFVNGPLGACLDHMKGPRKFEGRSRPRDMRTPRQEAYWRVG